MSIAVLSDGDEHLLASVWWKLGRSGWWSFNDSTFLEATPAASINLGMFKKSQFTPRRSRNHWIEYGLAYRCWSKYALTCEHTLHCRHNNIKGWADLAAFDAIPYDKDMKFNSMNNGRLRLEAVKVLTLSSTAHDCNTFRLVWSSGWSKATCLPPPTQCIRPKNWFANNFRNGNFDMDSTYAAGTFRILWRPYSWRSKYCSVSFDEGPKGVFMLADDERERHVSMTAYVSKSDDCTDKWMVIMGSKQFSWIPKLLDRSLHRKSEACVVYGWVWRYSERKERSGR